MDIALIHVVTCLLEQAGLMLPSCHCQLSISGRGLTVTTQDIANMLPAPRLPSYGPLPHYLARFRSIAMTQIGRTWLCRIDIRFTIVLFLYRLAWSNQWWPSHCNTAPFHLTALRGSCVSPEDELSLGPYSSTRWLFPPEKWYIYFSVSTCKPGAFGFCECVLSMARITYWVRFGGIHALQEIVFEVNMNFEIVSHLQVFMGVVLQLQSVLRLVYWHLSRNAMSSFLYSFRGQVNCFWLFADFQGIFL